MRTVCDAYIRQDTGQAAEPPCSCWINASITFRMLLVASLSGQLQACMYSLCGTMWVTQSS